MDQPVVYKLGESPLHKVRPDLSGTVFEGQDTTLVRWIIPSDRAATPLHSHAEHEQFTIVVSGSIETTVGEAVLTLRPGDMCRIERNVPHGGTRALGGADAVLVDVFSPPRADYIPAARAQA